MNKGQRAKHIKALSGVTTPSDMVQAKRLAKMTRRFVELISYHLDRFNSVFDELAGATLADKQTVFFDVIAAETDGDLILHDLGEMLDGIIVIVNDNKEEGVDDVVPSFTDADVTAYLP